MARRPHAFCAVLALSASIAGCSSASEDSTSTAASTAAVSTAAPTTEAAPSTAAPTTSQPEQCITLYYEDLAQVELISPTGTRVLIDINDPNRLSSPATSADVLLTTHTHWDHVDERFQSTFPGPQLFTTEGVLDAGDVHIVGVPSVHMASHTPQPSGGTNYLYVVDMAGLRIVHFGDIGQNDLTAEQLTTLGHIDVAITQFANEYSRMDEYNKKGFHLMDQAAPTLILPTHLDRATARLLSERGQGAFVVGPSVKVCPSGLDGPVRFLLMGQNAADYADRLGLGELAPTGCLCRLD